MTMRRYALRSALMALTALILSACGDLNPTEQSLSRTATAFFAATRAPSSAAGSASRPTTLPVRVPASVIAPATPTPIPAVVGSAAVGTTARVSSAVVSATATTTRVPAAMPVQVVTITADGNVNLRSAPSADAPVVTQLRPDTDVTVVQASVAAQDGSTDTTWVKVSANGQIGYIRNDLVSLPHAPTLSATFATVTRTAASSP